MWRNAQKSGFRSFKNTLLFVYRMSPVVLTFALLSQSKIKKELKVWVADFEKQNGRPPTSDEKLAIEDKFIAYKSVRYVLVILKSCFRGFASCFMLSHSNEYVYNNILLCAAYYSCILCSLFNVQVTTQLEEANSYIAQISEMLQSIKGLA